MQISLKIYIFIFWANSLFYQKYTKCFCCLFYFGCCCCCCFLFSNKNYVAKLFALIVNELLHQFQQCTRTFATFTTRNKSRKKEPFTWHLLCKKYLYLYDCVRYFHLTGWGWRKLNLTPPSSPPYTWKLLLAILKNCWRKKVRTFVKRKNEKKINGLGFYVSFYSETSTHACIKLQKKRRKNNRQTNQTVWMLICIITISSSVNDMKRVERKITEVKTETIDSTVTRKNMPYAIPIDSGK